MTALAYLGALTVSLAGLATIDRRWALAFWSDARRTALVLAIGVAGFLVWDLLGIATGVFFRGDGPYMTGVLIAPELPLEEVVFLTLLMYNTLLVWRAADRWFAAWSTS